MSQLFRSSQRPAGGKRRTGLRLLTATVLMIGVTTIIAPAATAGAELDRHVVVQLHDPTVLDEILADHELKIVTALVPSRGVYVLTPAEPVTKKDAAKKAAKKLENDPEVVWAEVKSPTDDDPDDDRFHAWPEGEFVEGYGVESWRDQEALEHMQLDSVHLRATGDGITVAILDTGIDLDHPQLTAHLAHDAHYDYVDDDPDPTDEVDGVDNDGDGVADEAFGHGTHAAGLVALVAPDAEIISLRVLNADGSGDPYVVALAVHDAIDAGADVINVSFGMDGKPKSRFLKEAFKRAKKENVVVVAAVGNNGNDEKDRFPAYEKEVIGVAAAGRDHILTGFSNYGKTAFVAAPGQDVISTLPGGGFGSWSGTSMAAPIVSGQAALVLEMNPDVKVKKVIERVGKSSKKIRGGNKINKGMINILRSLED